MLIKLKYHLNWNVTKNEMSLKLKCLQNLNVPKTKMLQDPNFIFFLQEIGTDCLGLVLAQ